MIRAFHSEGCPRRGDIVAIEALFSLRLYSSASLLTVGLRFYQTYPCTGTGTGTLLLIERAMLTWSHSYWCVLIASKLAAQGDPTLPLACNTRSHLHVCRPWCRM